MIIFHAAYQKNTAKELAVEMYRVRIMTTLTLNEQLNRVGVIIQKVLKFIMWHIDARQNVAG
jgi:hypothetical protein